MNLEKSPTGCLVCLNSTENILISPEQSQDIFNVCSSYVKDAIKIEFLVKNINFNKNKLSFCKNCLDYSLNLSQLVENLSKLQKEIDDFTNNFSEAIAKYRRQAAANEQKKQFTDENLKVLQILTLSSDTDENCSQPYVCESSSHLIAGHHLIDVDEIENEIVKIEEDSVFLDTEDESCAVDVSDYKIEECETNSLEEAEDEIDPLGQIDSQSTYEVVNNSNVIINESKSQKGISKAFTRLVSSSRTPNIALKRIRKNVTSNSGGTVNFITTSLQDEPRVNVNKSRPSSTKQRCNSKSKTTIVKHKKSKSIKRSHKYNCSICQKSFQGKFTLNRHYMLHTGEKPYECSYCGKAYIQLYNLKLHEGRHTGERPYKKRKTREKVERIFEKDDF